MILEDVPTGELRIGDVPTGELQQSEDVPKGELHVERTSGNEDRFYIEEWACQDDDDLASTRPVHT